MTAAGGGKCPGCDEKAKPGAATCGKDACKRISARQTRSERELQERLRYMQEVLHG